jgi:hypothetical protein
MDLLELILNGENIRTVVLIIAMLLGVTWLDRSFNRKIDERFAAYDKKMDERFALVDGKFVEFDKKMDLRFKMLKENDFAHLNRTIKELTFVLEKNDFLSAEDKRHIDSHLDD